MFWFFVILNVFEFSHLYMFLVYVVGFLTCPFRYADVGLDRPVGMAPFQRRVEGMGGIDGNLLSHLEHLTAHVLGANMNSIPIDMQMYIVGVSQRMWRVLRRVTATVLC